MALESDAPWGEGIVWIITGKKYGTYEYSTDIVRGGGTSLNTCAPAPGPSLTTFQVGSSHLSSIPSRNGDPQPS